jgi:hypothetical protein
MKRSAFSAAMIAGVMALCSVPHDASAATVSIFSQNTGPLPSAGLIVNPAPSSTSGNVIYPETGSLANRYRSPFEEYGSPGTITQGYENVPYTTIGSFAAGSATYNFASAMDTLVILWGSPDSYNTLDFWSGQNHTGTLLGSFTGSQLAVQTYGYDLVTFISALGFESVVLSSSNAAFEFADLQASAPLPAALPLFATGLGVMGYLARRRKKRAGGAAMAAAA